MTGGGSLTFLVRLTPRAAADRVEEIEVLADGREALKARVRAVPEKGKANTALASLLAGYFGLGKNAVEITSGRTSRFKTVTITWSGEAGAVIEKLRARLET